MLISLLYNNNNNDIQYIIILITIIGLIYNIKKFSICYTKLKYINIIYNAVTNTL